MSTQVLSMLLSLYLAFAPYVPSGEVNVMVVGDVMMHLPVTQSGYDASKKSYQFDSIFQEVKPILNQADIVIGNLETPLAGEKVGYSGYPMFNAPKEIALALKNTGFDVLTTANNHTLDRKENGVIQTLDSLDQYGIVHTGSARTQEEQNKPVILEVNGLRIGLIAYTYGTNGIPVPKDKSYLVNLLDPAQVTEEINRLKEQRVDYILGMIHYGTEYQRLPNDIQKKWTDFLYKSGVDFVLGSHPHVVQTLELENGWNGPSDKGVIYSMGNFLSNQSGEWKDYGVILDLKLKKNWIANRVEIVDASVIPTFVANYYESGKKKYRIKPLNTQSKNVDPILFAKGNDLVKHVMGR